MSVTVSCPTCSNTQSISEELIGKKIRCRSCQEVFAAEAVKAKVGAAGPVGRTAQQEGARRNGSANGIASTKVTPAPVKAATKSAGGKNIALFGGGAGIVILAGVLVWVFFLRGEKTTIAPTPNTDDHANRPSPALHFKDTAATDTAPPNVATNSKPADTAQPAIENKSAPVVRTSLNKLKAGFSESPKSIPPMISPDVVERLKKSAVMLRVTSIVGTGEGSGWFAEPGIIVTNSHVVMMKEAAMPPPQKIRVFLHPGESDEREVSGKLLALDRVNDLAIVQVKGKDLPEPLPICPSAEVFEGQRLYVVGFPLGSMLAQAASYGSPPGDRAAVTVKIRQTTVAARLPYKNGGVKLLQIEGGADHGNSGGAVVDAAGNVRCILVAGYDGTTMRFAIPSEFAVYLLQGRLLSVDPGQAYRAGAGARQPLKAWVADPMKRIKNVSLSVWAGERGNGVRPSVDRQPGPISGDSAHVQVDLAYDPHLVARVGDALPAVGECDLPDKRTGQVYWMQPRYERTDGTIAWGEAAVAEFTGAPVDRRGAHLVVKHVAGSQCTSDVEHKFTFGIGLEGLPVPAFGGQAIKVNLTEKTRNVEPDGTARVQLRYNDLGFQDEDTDEFVRIHLKDALKAVKGMALEMNVTKRGLIKSPNLNMNQVPLQYRSFLSLFNYQILQALEEMSLVLPDREVNANDGWIDDTQHTYIFNKQLFGTDNTINAISRVRYQFLGVRNRDGREEGVVSFEGRMIKGDGASPVTTGDSNATGGEIDAINEESERRKGVYGVIRGAALIDLKTGLTTLVRSVSEVAMNIKAKFKNEDNEDKEITLVYGTESETVFRRHLDSATAKLETDVLLPNQTVQLNAFVGVPDPNLAASPSAGTADSGENAPGATGTAPLQMKKEVLDKVKAAGCIVRCQRDDGGGDGSGWLVEPGIVITNAHVVGMVDRAARPPTGVDIYFDYGLPTVKKFAGKILLVDHDNDLCVLELPTKEGLPEPFPIVPSTDLYEGQRLFVVGFPKGANKSRMMSDGIDALATQISIRDSSVSGRLENKKTKLLKYVMVEGGLTPGNSGGALVDMNGAVRCVAVAIMPGTQIGFTIPSEFAARLLQGYPLEVKPQMPYKDGSIVKLPVEMKFGDPLRRVKKVYVDYWVGKEGKPRRGSRVRPEPRSDDSERQSIECSYDSEKMTAMGEFVPPDAPPGTAYWIQPRFIDGTGKEAWGEAIFYRPDGPPVERREVRLFAKFVPGSKRYLDMRIDADYRYIYFGADVGRVNHLFVGLEEEVGKSSGAGKTFPVQYKYTDLKFGPPRTRGDLIKAILAFITTQNGNIIDTVKKIISGAIFTNEGVMTNKVVANYDQLPIIAQVVGLFKEFNNMVLQGVQTMSIRFPNKIVQYGETWEHPTNLLIETRNRTEPALFTVTMKYLGVRDREGRQEAVLEVKGTVRNDPNSKAKDLTELKSENPDDKDGNDPKDGDTPKDDTPKDQPKGKAKPKGGPPKGSSAEFDADELKPMLMRIMQDLPPSQITGKRPLYGMVRGKAYIDVESGVVSYCELFVDIDVEVKHRDRQTGAEVPVQAGGTIEMEMHRRSSFR